MYDSKSIREISVREARDLGVFISPALPLLESDLEVRATELIVKRLLAMNAAVASAAGLGQSRAIAWLERESLIDYLARDEKNWLFKNKGRLHLYCRVEGLWALTWVLGVAPILDFSKACSDNLVYLLPHLLEDESSRRFRDEVRVRDLYEIVSACDLAYCLHWSVRDSQLRKVALPDCIDPETIEERRRALEWVLGDTSWESVPLDT